MDVQKKKTDCRYLCVRNACCRNRKPILQLQKWIFRVIYNIFCMTIDNIDKK